MSDDAWRALGDILEPRVGRASARSEATRRFIDAVNHLLASGKPWRDLDERFGPWNSIYVRFSRWAEQGVWDLLLERMAQLGLTDDWCHLNDPISGNGATLESEAVGGRLRKAMVDRAAHWRTGGSGGGPSIQVARHAEESSPKTKPIDGGAGAGASRALGGLGRGPTVAISVRLPVATVRELDDWIETSNARMTRATAVTTLLERGLRLG